MNTPFQDFLGSFREEIRFTSEPDAQVEACMRCRADTMAWVYTATHEKLVQICQGCGTRFAMEVVKITPCSGEVAELTLLDHITGRHTTQLGRLTRER